MAGGRPLGTFSDPARRARAWHWLAATMALACEDKARDLDRPDSPSSKGLDRKRSEELTSDLQSLMRIQYAFFFLIKKHLRTNTDSNTTSLTRTMYSHL